MPLHLHWRGGAGLCVRHHRWCSLAPALPPGSASRTHPWTRECCVAHALRAPWAVRSPRYCCFSPGAHPLMTGKHLHTRRLAQRRMKTWRYAHAGPPAAAASVSQHPAGCPRPLAGDTPASAGEPCDADPAPRSTVRLAGVGRRHGAVPPRRTPSLTDVASSTRRPSRGLFPPLVRVRHDCPARPAGRACCVACACRGHDGELTSRGVCPSQPTADAPTGAATKAKPKINRCVCRAPPRGPHTWGGGGRWVGSARAWRRCLEARPRSRRRACAALDAARQRPGRCSVRRRLAAGQMRAGGTTVWEVAAVHSPALWHHLLHLG